MRGEVLTGLFAVLGTVVGSAAPLLTSSRDSRVRAKESASERARHLEDAWRIEVAAFVRCADLLENRIREVAEYQHASQVPGELKGKYLEAWEALIESGATLAVHAPAKVEDAGRRLAEALAALCNHLDGWLRGGPWDAHEFDRLRDTRKAKRAALLTEVRGASDSPPG